MYKINEGVILLIDLVTIYNSQNYGADSPAPTTFNEPQAVTENAHAQSDMINQSFRISKCTLQELVDFHRLNIVEFLYGRAGSNYAMETFASFAESFAI